MKNQTQRGRTITVVAPYAVTAGDGVQVGTSIFGVASHDAASGANLELQLDGAFGLKALSTDTPAQGAILYWDNTNKQLTTTASTHIKAGVALEAKASGAAVASTLINYVR